MDSAERTGLERFYVTIIQGDRSQDFVKEHLEAYIFELFKNVSDISKLGELRDCYIDAFEWVLANLSRTAGIQLYDDGEIRINIIPSEIKDGKKCIILGESDIANSKLNSVLYDELERLLICGLQLC